MDTTNIITVLQPRWHDRAVLVANWRIVAGMNRITMPRAKNHPDYYMTGVELWAYPLETKISKAGKPFDVRVVPLDDLKATAEVIVKSDPIDSTSANYRNQTQPQAVEIKLDNQIAFL